MKDNLLYDQVIPIANYIRIDHENSIEVSDFDIKEDEQKTEQEIKTENNSNMKMTNEANPKEL